MKTLTDAWGQVGAALLLTVGAVAAGAGPAAAATGAGEVYVGARGTDGNPCSAAAPCASLTRALGAVASGGTVHLDAGVFTGITRVPAGLTVTIAGAGSASTTLFGGLAGTVLTVPDDTKVKLVDLAVAGGLSPGYGGGILTDGDLTILRTHVSYNQAVRGGGIASDNSTTLTIIDSVIDVNTAASNYHDAAGAGIYLLSGSLSISGSTLSANRLVGRGWGTALLTFWRSSVAITNSTIAGNYGAEDTNGMALSDITQTTLRHVTVTANPSAIRGNPENTLSGTVDVAASVITGACRFMDFDDQQFSDTVVDDRSCALSGRTSTSLPGVSVEPGLTTAELQDNGGPTRTRLLPHDSPARAAVPFESGLCTGADQRGLPWRNAGTISCDAGAVQTPPDLQPSAAALDFGLHGPGDLATATLTLTNVGPEPLDLGDPTVTGDYRITEGCRHSVLAPGQGCTVLLKLRVALGGNPGTLRLDYTGAHTRSALVIPLSGTGTDVPVNLTDPGPGDVPHAGVTATADPGQWAGLQPIEYEYEWWLCDGDADNCPTLVGTGTTYTPSADQIGWALRVRVTATNPAGRREAAGSMWLVRP
ncbi:choice-of-anchor Q domain-containing protein [Dactylosporangium sp. NPDC051541]|uniref:choice-of-anchor Q domain-containing protein n=1 Tax=Dactylosporangium sp. NPDC051541 TaxID=3363977 RepID=UPI0037A633E8